MVRVTMAEHVRISSQDVGHERSASSGSGSSSSTSTQSPRQRAPMGIPKIRHVEAPPPLPPPRFIDDLAHGHDLSWELQNQGDEFGPHRKLAPIKHSSSLFGGYMAPGRGNSLRNDDEDEGIDVMELDDDYNRKDSSCTIRPPPSQAEIETASLAVGRIQSLGRRPPSPLAGSNQRLHGETPLAQQNLSRSSHAYDKHLLSRIGKPSSPPRRHNSDFEDTSSLLVQSRQSINVRETGLSPLSMADASSSSADPISRWITSPTTSAGLSPALRQPWRDSAMDYRSPSADDSAPPSVVDRDFFPRLRESNRHTPSGGPENSLSHASRSNRGSYDQATYVDPETDLSIEDSGTFHTLSLGDSRFSLATRQEAASKPGTKRRALSPPTDMVRDDKVPAHVESHHRVTSTFAARSPNTQYLKYGSVSSTASSVRPESYTSSAGLSAAGSSMTSVSSFLGHSPARLSPSLEAPQDSLYVTSVAPSKPVLSITTSKKPQDRASVDGRTLPTTNKMSTQTQVDESRPAATNRLTGHYICECCPKKPKKFDTENELRLHEMEKQYSCQYCNNRFKNKNEAERHQNSLHLRRHSWSCAAISGYEAAFHPSTSPAAQTSDGPNSDACGYCGEEFPNYPRPDWERRYEHLTNIHKFGECNQSKKFFRADHFRQHLKHSHAGRSGKWTNMLESACVKDESQDLGPATSSPKGELNHRSTEST